MSSDEFQPIQGMVDLAYPEIALWQQLEQQSRSILHLYGFTEVRTPVVERRSVFDRSLGDSTDVVQKEMYQFEDAGGRLLVLRPEGTAGITRYIARIGQDGASARVYYIGPMFRRERPQAGRYRQFHQLGVEAIGEPNPHVDAEIMAMQIHLLKAWGLSQFQVKLNTRGESEDQALVKAFLEKELQPHLDRLCDNCRRRYNENILRILDCKNPACRDVVSSLPPATEAMSEKSKNYLAEVLRILERLEIPAVIDPTLVRGFDYYRHTVWEITHSGLGAQDAIAGGGRYSITMGSRVIPGVGFAMGIERVIMALKSESAALPGEIKDQVWLVSMDESLLDVHLQLAQTLRMRGISCFLDMSGRSVKAQMRSAGKSGARWVVLHGRHEEEKGTFQLKNMESGVQEEVEMPVLLERIKASPVHAL
ncbi:MAG TPA: histidine--tRNA ligase [Kiritimatiellia bacterium]|nr:histidine--tRNA ligase [Kiritimatiellia bacterium]